MDSGLDNSCSNVDIGVVVWTLAVDSDVDSGLDNSYSDVETGVVVWTVPCG